MSRTVVLSISIIAIFALTAVSSAQAQNDHKGWRVRVFAGIEGRFVEDDNTTFDDPTFGVCSTEVDGTGFGFGADVERRFNKIVGLDLAIGFTQLDVVFAQSLTSYVSETTLDVTPIWLAANFHFVNTEKLDFWFGPQIAYIFWSGPLVFEVPGQPDFTVETENEFPAIGFDFGLDWWLFNKGGLNFAFRFVDADANTSHKLPVDPTFVTLGYTWKL